MAGNAVVGHAQLPVPAGWRVTERTSNRLTLKNEPGTQAITFTGLAFGVTPGLEEFKLLCRHRMDAEGKDAPDVFIQEGEPAPTRDSLVFFYSGADKKSGRIFSGQLLLVDKQLTTTYLESVGIDPKKHLAFFSEVVRSLIIERK